MKFRLELRDPVGQPVASWEFEAARGQIPVEYERGLTSRASFPVSPGGHPAAVPYVVLTLLKKEE